VNFPVERNPEAAWPHFVGWRVNYEEAAYAIAAALDAVRRSGPGRAGPRWSRFPRYAQGPACRFLSAERTGTTGRCLVSP
jgi:hypothetical protein